MGALISLLMMAGLPGDTWLRLIIWLIIGMVIYFSYGRHHSRVQRAEATQERSAASRRWQIKNIASEKGLPRFVEGLFVL